MFNIIHVIYSLSIITYTIYLSLSNGLLIVTCHSNNPDIITYIIGLVFELLVCYFTIGTYYMRKNYNALYCSILINLYCIILHGLISYLIYRNACNIIYIMLTFSIIGDLCSILLYTSCVLTILTS